MMRIRWIALLLLVTATSFCFGDEASVPSWKQKDFLITFWCPPPATDENFANVAKEGFNLTEGEEESLDIAARHGLRVMLTDNLLNPATLDNPAARATLDGLIARVKDHPALEAYYITDEPGAQAFAGLGSLVAYLRERDPNHLAYINLFPTYASGQQLGVSVDSLTDGVELRYREHLRQYIETVHPDLLSYDHYHFLKNADGTQYFLNLNLIRAAALDAQRPFLNIIQANTIDPRWRLPNAAEMRWLVFTTMAYGGRGISYFTYWGPKEYNGLYQEGKPAPQLNDVVRLNREIARFGPTLMRLNSAGVYHTEPLPQGTEAIPANSPVQVQGGEFVLGLFGDRQRPRTFMIVNRNYSRPAEARLLISIPGNRVQEIDRRTGKWSEVAELPPQRTLTVSLSAGDGRLFRVLP